MLEFIIGAKSWQRQAMAGAWRGRGREKAVHRSALFSCTPFGSAEKLDTVQADKSC
jgi:hypothetical protein